MKKISSKLGANSFLKEVEEVSSGDNLFFDKEIGSLLNFEFDAQVKFKSLSYALLCIESQFDCLPSLKKALSNELCTLGQVQHLKEAYILFLQNQIAALENPVLQKKILSYQAPLINATLDKLVECSLNKKRHRLSGWSAKDFQVTCLSAFLHPLRQSVGSCFATAPAIRIQQQQPFLFFKDVFELLDTGLLKRTFEGIEQSIPLNLSVQSNYIEQPFVMPHIKEFRKSIECKAVLQLTDLSISELHQKDLWPKEGALSTLKTLLQLSKKTSEKNKKQSKSSDFLQMERRELLDISLDQETGEKEKNYELAALFSHPLLKAWEYSLASFAESKSDFVKWNLFHGLGWDSKQKSGLGEVVFKSLESFIKQDEQKIDELNRKYEEAFFQLKFLERKLNSNESSLDNWARVEYQNHLNHFNSIYREREKVALLSEKSTKILPQLERFYFERISHYFQELYDPAIQKTDLKAYGDSPAGFRLYYKHGRTDPLMWSPICSDEQFITSLVEFFQVTEHELLKDSRFEGLESKLQLILNEMITHIQTYSFIENSYSRVCLLRNYSLDSLNSKESSLYKPWSYISGGSLTQLLKNYYKNESGFTSLSKNVANEMELLVFIIDFVKDLNDASISEFVKNKLKSLFITSPNHAFLLQPGKLPLLKIIEQRQTFSYTWVRDEWQLPYQNFLSTIEVSPYEMNFFFEYFLKDKPYLHVWIKNEIKLPNYSLNICDFRKLLSFVLKEVPRKFSQEFSESTLDSWCQRFFPVFYKKNLIDKLNELFDEFSLTIEQKNQYLKTARIFLYQNLENESISSEQILELVIACIRLNAEKPGFNGVKLDYLIEKLRKYQMQMPAPLIFGDTNWSYYDFGFALNFITFKPQLWRFEKFSQRGFSMSEWSSLFSETKPGAWEILSIPAQYESISDV